MKESIRKVALPEVGEEFKRLRKNKRMTLADAAKIMRMSAVAVNKKEASLRYEELERICELLDLGKPFSLARLLDMYELRQFEHKELGKVPAVQSPTKDHILYAELFNGDIARIHAHTGVVLNIMKAVPNTKPSMRHEE